VSPDLDPCGRGGPQLLGRQLRVEPADPAPLACGGLARAPRGTSGDIRESGFRRSRALRRAASQRRPRSLAFTNCPKGQSGVLGSLSPQVTLPGPVDPERLHDGLDAGVQCEWGLQNSSSGRVIENLSTRAPKGLDRKRGESGTEAVGLLSRVQHEAVDEPPRLTSEPLL
jgi:hypothetical protein